MSSLHSFGMACKRSAGFTVGKPAYTGEDDTGLLLYPCIAATGWLGVTLPCHGATVSWREICTDHMAPGDSAP